MTLNRKTDLRTQWKFIVSVHNSFLQCELLRARLASRISRGYFFPAVFFRVIRDELSERGTTGSLLRGGWSFGLTKCIIFLTVSYNCLNRHVDSTRTTIALSFMSTTPGLSGSSDPINAAVVGTLRSTTANALIPVLLMVQCTGITLETSTYTTMPI